VDLLFLVFIFILELLKSNKSDLKANKKDLFQISLSSNHSIFDKISNLLFSDKLASFGPIFVSNNFCLLVIRLCKSQTFNLFFKSCNCLYNSFPGQAVCQASLCQIIG